MNIALFTDTFPPEINGVATSTYNLMEILRKNGHRCLVVTTNPFSNTITFEDDVLRIPGLELKKLYGYRLAKFYSSKAMRMIRQTKPDLIHVQTDASIGIFGRLAANQLKIPMILTYHTMVEDYTYYVTKGNKTFDRFAKSVVRAYCKIRADQATEFISPSVKTKEIVRSYGFQSYINVVPTGIDFAKYRQPVEQKKKEEVIEKYGLQDSFVVLSLGRIAKEKSIDVTIRAFGKLKEHADFPVKMLIVGGGPDVKELQDLVQSLSLQKDVLFVGAVPTEETPLYYQVSNIFVSASVTETQGLTYVEAMAAGIPVFARYDENLSEVIINGETGFYFENEEDFAQKVIRYYHLEKSKKEFLKSSADKVAQRFSMEMFYKEMMEVYLRALRKYW